MQVYILFGCHNGYHCILGIFDTPELASKELDARKGDGWQDFYTVSKCVQCA